MNTVFWLILAVLIIVAILIVVWPLIKVKPLTESNAEQRNLAIARQRLAELDQQLASGELSEQQYQWQYQELQQCLNDDLTAGANPAIPQTRGQGRWMIPVLILLLPVISLFLYFDLGDTHAEQKLQMLAQQSDNLQQVERVIPQLVERLKQNPDDLTGWLMLARSYKFLEKYQEAAAVYTRLYKIYPDNLEIMLGYAETLAVLHQGNLSGEPANLAFKAVQLAPDNKDALWMAGLAKVQTGAADEGVAYWQKLIAQLPSDSESAAQIKQMISEVSAQATEPAAPAADNALNIHVNVTIDDNLKAKAQAEQVLFVYAQAIDGPKMPLAIMRKQVADLPLSVDLNDSLAMSPTQKLSGFNHVRVLARVSKSGNAMPQSGDLLGSAELQLQGNDNNVNITINQEVN